MALKDLVQMAISQQATDLHLEAGIPPTLRVNGSLRKGSTPLSRDTLHSIAERLIPESDWSHFLSRGSYDLTQVVAGVQCRINIFRTDKGFGFAIRLLSTSTNTLESCNLHPQLLELLSHDSGLIIVTGPTGSGKSTTLAALVEEINQKSAKHIITLESPIEYRLRPKKSMIRQREVGEHTPSYEQGLMDALREDPDIIVVGEMRDAEAMRWTLNAAETGHLVLVTMHSSNAAEAIYRLMMSFAPERQSSVLAQLADCLIGIVSQKMTYRPDVKLMVPCLEILNGNYASKNVIRKGDVVKLQSLLQTGGNEGQWTFERYQTWLDSKTDWSYPSPPDLSSVDDAQEESPYEYPRRTSQTASVYSESRSKPQPKRGSSPRSAAEDFAFKMTETYELDRDINNAHSSEPNREMSFDEGQNSGTPEPTYARSSRSPYLNSVPASSSIAKRVSAPKRAPSSSESTTDSRNGVAGKGKSDKSKSMKIHKDGRIEIPDLDLDLNELVKSIGKFDGE